MAQISFKGNATRDAELKSTPNGQAVANIDVAENHWKKNGQDWVEDGVTFYRVTLWGSLAERLAGHILRGTTLTVAGEFRSSEFEGKNGSVKTYEVNAKAVGIVPKAEGQGQQQGGYQQSQQAGGWGIQPQQAQGGGWDQNQSGGQDDSRPPF